MPSGQRQSARRTGSIGRCTRTVNSSVQSKTDSGEPRNQPVRIVPGSGALLGPTRVGDGDTLDVPGVQVRRHGIDTPMSEQSCQAGVRRWSCRAEVTWALAGRNGGKPAECERGDQDCYGASLR